MAAHTLQILQHANAASSDMPPLLCFLTQVFGYPTMHGTVDIVLPSNLHAQSSQLQAGNKNFDIISKYFFRLANSMKSFSSPS